MQRISSESARVAVLGSLLLFASALPRTPALAVSCACPYEIASSATQAFGVGMQHQKELRTLESVTSPRLASSRALPDRAWTLQAGCRNASATALPASESSFVQTPSPIRGPARLLFGLPIDLRQADAETLMVLPGIGAVRAQAILAQREAGGLRSVSDLLRIKGIGPKTLRGIEARVAVDYADPCACKQGGLVPVPSRGDAMVRHSSESGQP